MSKECRVSCRALKDFRVREHTTLHGIEREIKTGDYVNLLKKHYRLFLSLGAVEQYKLGVYDERPKEEGIEGI